MSELRQREEAFRSSKYLNGARGETCKLRFVGVCGGGTDTTVSCHIHDAGFGAARKAHDFSVIDGCHACHMFLDHGWVGKISETIRLRHIIRGFQETLHARLKAGIAFIPEDIKAPSHARPVKARKPPDQRKPVPAGAPLPGSKASGFRRRMDGTVERRP